MNAVDVKDLKTVVGIFQLGAYELNPVRPTLAFPFLRGFPPWGPPRPRKQALRTVCFHQ